MYEDILQITALKAANNFYQLKGLRKSKAWFFTIATNSIRDFYGSKKESVSIEEISSPLTDVGVEKESYTDLKLSLATYIKRLPTQKQNLIYLYMQNTYTVREISAILNIGYSTARKWLDEIKDVLYGELYNK